MRSFVVLFVTAAAFGVVIAAVYWYSSYDPAGTFMLGFMAAALIFAAGYALVAERDADLPGDEERLEIRDAAGEDLGIVTTRSAWPSVGAVCILLLIVAAVWAPGLSIVPLAALLLVFWRLGAESSRVT